MGSPLCCRERDEVFEPRKSLGQSNSRSIKTSLLNRGRGRGKRIPGITRESMPPPTAQVKLSAAHGQTGDLCFEACYFVL
jgi:hypothetical protein